MHQPVPTITPASPVVRSAREVITHSGAVTLALLADPMRDLRAIRRLNPALALALAPFLDAVMDLDARTGFLDDPSAA